MKAIIFFKLSKYIFKHFINTNINHP